MGRTQTVARSQWLSQNAAVRKMRHGNEPQESIPIGSAGRPECGLGQSITVGTDQTTNAGKKIALDAGSEITLQTGEATVTLKKNGDIVISGKNLTINTSGKVDLKADGNVSAKGKDFTVNASGKVNLKASGEVVVKGSKVGLN